MAASGGSWKAGSFVASGGNSKSGAVSAKPSPDELSAKARSIDDQIRQLKAQSGRGKKERLAEINRLVGDREDTLYRLYRALQEQP